MLVALDILMLQCHYPALLVSGPSVDTCMQDILLLITTDLRLHVE